MAHVKQTLQNVCSLVDVQFSEASTTIIISIETLLLFFSLFNLLSAV